MLSFRRARIQSGEVPRGQFPTCKLSTVRGAFQSVSQNAAILSSAPELDQVGQLVGNDLARRRLRQRADHAPAQTT